jgi:steroid delta-isomerase-like uncharacterized protein
MASTSELLDRFVTLFNEGRFDEGEQDYAPNGFEEEIGTSGRFTPQEATASARKWKEAFPDATGTITNKIVEGRRGAAEIVWKGTNRGSFMGQPATGKPITVRATVVIESDGNKILRAAHYIDIAGMMHQLGVSMAAHATS